MKRLVYFLLVPILFGACVKNNPDPSWIEVNEWSLENNPVFTGGEDGILTENFNNAWVYADEELVGVFEVPFKIPLLKEGNVELTIFPTIHNNGISATKKKYPFVKPYKIQVDLVKNETVVIHPTTMYYDEAKFWIEDFEDQTAIQLADGPASTTPSFNSNDPAVLNPEINGGYFRRVDITSSNSRWVASTTANSNGTINMPLPKGQEVYVEIDYHTTNRVTSGLLGVSSNGIQENPNVQMNPANDGEAYWKKIYVELGEVVSGMTSADYFELSFDALIDDGQSSGQINIDNIKVVYF